MKFKAFYLLIFLTLTCTGCVSRENQLTLTPNFVTAVLPTPISIQPTATLDLPAPTDTTPMPISSIEGTTTTQVNIRAQPSKSSEALGMLNIFTKIQIVGKDSSGGWYQIRYADSFGWVSAEYVQVNIGAEIPLGITTKPTAAQITAQPAASYPVAAPDGDSMQSPLATIKFSPLTAQALQVNNAISAPDGNTEDWLQFTAYNYFVKIKILCADVGLHVELWNSTARVDDFPLACGSEKIISVIPENSYFASLSAENTNEFRYIKYTVILESIH